MKKTKIVCSIGLHQTDEEIKQMLQSGMNVARFDLGSLSYDYCEKMIAKVRDIASKLGLVCGIMVENSGPTLRVGTLDNGHITLKEGSEIEIYNKPRVGTKEGFSILYSNLLKDVREGTHLLFGDATAELEVTAKMTETLICKVVKGGELTNKEIVHIPTIHLSAPYVSQKDRDDIAFAHRLGVDFLALSFVRSHEDILDITDALIEEDDEHIQLIAKIENKQSLEDIDAIINLCDGIMIARGDLGIEVSLERLPGIQKQIVKKAHLANKLAIVSTEMLTSMMVSTIPTRAEISDIYNAVMDSVDAVCLNKETSLGNHPVESVQMMTNIIEVAEEELDYGKILRDMNVTDLQDVTSSIAYSVIDMANHLNIKGIILATNTGYTAKKMSMFRPPVPVVATSPDDQTVSSLTLHYGIYPTKTKHFLTTDEIVIGCKKVITKELSLKEKDLVIITGGFPATAGYTNFMKVEEL